MCHKHYEVHMLATVEVLRDIILHLAKLVHYFEFSISVIN